MVVMDWLKKLTDIIMPIENIDEEEEVVEKKAEVKTEQVKEQAQQQQQQTQAQSLVETMAARRAAAGGGVNVNTANMAGMGNVVFKETTSRPNLKLIKAPEFIIKFYQPADYSQINSVADDILAHKAAVVNYEYVRTEEQLRLCDYIDGVCYAVDGTVTQISEKIFLYSPAGIQTSDIAALVASVRYH